MGYVDAENGARVASNVTGTDFIRYDNGAVDYLKSETSVPLESLAGLCVPIYCDKCFGTESEDYEDGVPSASKYDSFLVGVACKFGNFKMSGSAVERYRKYVMNTSMVYGMHHFSPGKVLFMHEVEHEIGEVLCYWHVHSEHTDHASMCCCIGIRENPFTEIVMKAAQQGMSTALSLGTLGDHSRGVTIQECSLVSVPMRQSCFAVVASSLSLPETVKKFGFSVEKSSRLLAGFDANTSADGDGARAESELREQLQAYKAVLESLLVQIFILTKRAKNPEDESIAYNFIGAEEFHDKTGIETQLTKAGAEAVTIKEMATPQPASAQQTAPTTNAVAVDQATWAAAAAAAASAFTALQQQQQQQQQSLQAQQFYNHLPQSGAPLYSFLPPPPRNLQFQEPPQPFHRNLMTYHAGGATVPTLFDENRIPAPQPMYLTSPEFYRHAGSSAAAFRQHPSVSPTASQPQPELSDAERQAIAEKYMKDQADKEAYHNKVIEVGIQKAMDVMRNCGVLEKQTEFQPKITPSISKAITSKPYDRKASNDAKNNTSPETIVTSVEALLELMRRSKDEGRISADGRQQQQQQQSATGGDGDQTVTRADLAVSESVQQASAATTSETSETGLEPAEASSSNVKAGFTKSERRSGSVTTVHKDLFDRVVELKK